MSYVDRYQIADQLITHFSTVIPTIHDSYLVSRYTGMVAVVGVTSYELAVKDIFIEFARLKHKVLEACTRDYFDRLNARIMYRSLHKEYAFHFGIKYQTKFRKKIRDTEKRLLRSQGKSILTCYNNLITWRHQFAHEGILPNTATFQEAVDCYEFGKNVIECLAASMQR
jgi:hypothetical protein